MLTCYFECMLTTKRVSFRILHLLYIQAKYFGEQFVKNRLLNSTIKGIDKKTQSSCAAICIMVCSRLIDCIHMLTTVTCSND